MITSIASNPTDRLLQDFLQTDYVVGSDGRELVARIGQVHPAIDALAAQRPWAIITAFNPGARRTEKAVNLQRHHELLMAVEQAGIDHFDAVNRDPAGRWPDEPGLFLAGVSGPAAIDLAHRFNQLALVYGRAEQPLELWLITGDWPAPLPDQVREMSP